MKKFLSLVLALTMALSLVTVSAGATDFDDDGDITYQEAVTVIAGMGIVDGYSDGTFGPDEALTRGAAAKIICNLILGPTTADALSASSAPFVDVPTTNTFAGYITYCSQQGIISGYADGTFRPTDTLSGNAFMKMLLGALGYDSDKEGYTGANWTVNVIKQAVGIELNDGNDDFVGSQAVTRQEACLYAFNTLKATMVEYSDNSTVTVGDITISSQGDYSDVTNGTSSDGNIEDDGLMQFAERYFRDLEAEDDTDDFGRPATTWTYDGDELGTYANDADATYVVGDTEDTLGTLVTDDACLDYSASDVLSDADVYYNGEDLGTYSSNRGNHLAGKGDIIEAYENDDNEVDTIVIRSYTYAKIDTVDEDLSSTHENNGASVALELVDIDDGSLGTWYDDYDDSDEVLTGYNSDYTEGTVLAVAISAADSDVILDSYIMESVTGTPSAARAVDYSTNNDDQVAEGTITIDGTRYEYAGQMTGLEDDENVDFDEEYTIYLTAEGYVLAVDGDASASLDDVYYVAGAYGERSAGRLTYYIETVAVQDGTYAVLELDSTDISTFGLTSSSYDYNNSGEGLCLLDEDDDEYSVVKALTDDATVGSYTVAVATYSDGDGDGLTQPVERDSTTIRLDNSDKDRLYLADDTFFIGVEGVTGGSEDLDNLDITTATGVMTMDPDKSSYLSVYVIYDDDQDAKFVVYAAAVLSGAVNIGDVVYLTDESNTATSDGYLVDLYLMDGMELVEDATVDQETSQGFYDHEINEDGVYELTSSSYELAGEVGDEDGYAENVIFTSVRSNRVTGATSDDSIEFVAVSFADAVVIDTRSTSDKNNSLYSGDIESASALSSAINRGTVTADVFVEDGEIVFVAVKSSARDTSIDDGDEYGDLDHIALSATTGYIGVYLDGNAEENTDYEVTLSILRDNGYVDIGTFTVTVSAGSNFGRTDISDNLIAGNNYQITCGDETFTIVYTGAST
ncbi:S-layer homology domain-containing protein [uncultured Oscillibacter sp.]|uniref:S-layer homology domain-containing protein n=1 Tax=uncultured Oscillibacter sp. TaxID=876091 RepID=UPI0025FC8588|nr:S-layer homology domain-containing protein [uncultured Oscillibacter sp.]